ncbi:Origin recognition complex subunit 4 [Rhynchospora pubera]|uniref:Origin of replication complex subunit 4 n=1 Tax=Rhynchospora pubera TaxID=906938 RepID=A0AAV8HFK8_9POAL|nr:Origin recognition complex subunit 4 [Rhynchospora pubera]
MEVSEQAAIALRQLRERLCSRTLAHSLLLYSSDNNFSKLKFHISSSISAACSKVLLLRGDKGSGKSAVVELVLKDLKAEHPDSISVVTLYGLLHSDDDISALEEIARQLCVGHKFSFSKTVSLDENKEFLMDMLKEYGLARKTVVFVLDEFHLFTQGKQWLLYTLFDAMETFTSQSIIIIGLSCLEGSEQQLEKRVRSRFSSCTLLFGPPSEEDRIRLLEQLLHLQKDSSLASKYVVEFNSRLDKIFSDKKFKEILSYVTCADGSTNHLLRFLFTASSYMDMESGFLSLQSFERAYSLMKRQPKFASLHDLSVLELYILVCMHRLQCKEETSYNFNSVMKEYKAIQDAHKTSDNYSHAVCLRAFEHLLDRELISFTDTKGRNDSIKFRPVKLLVSSRELDSSLKSNPSCPTILQKLLDHESYM